MTSPTGKGGEEVEVTDLRLVSISADARDYEALPVAVRVEFELGRFMSRPEKDGMRVRAQASVDFFGDAEPDEAVAQIVLWYEIDLLMSEDQVQLTVGNGPQMKELTDTLIAPVLFPYVRAKVHELSNELPLPVTLLPVGTLTREGEERLD